MIAIGMEPIGDVRNFNLLVAASEENTGQIGFELPVRLHLEGENLGPSCFIGSAADPILIAAQQERAASSLFFGADPMTSRSRCTGLFDAKLNGFVGLPAAAGASEVVLADNLFEFVGAGYEGTAPDGGAELQAAFNAAK